MMNKILILGNARHGKDTLAELLGERFGMTYKSSSEMAMELFLFEVLKEKNGYETIQECFDDRVNHRQTWYLSICDYNKSDRARLAKDILEGYDCYVGMRDLEEFEASKELFDVIIWVDASKRLGTSEYTNKIPVSEADMVITNDGAFEDFKEKARLLGKMLFDSETDKKLFKNSKIHW